MARPLLLSLLAVLLLGACVDATAPEELRYGRYTLRRMNGEDLPGALVVNSVARLELVSGALRLNRSGDFNDSTQIRLTELSTGAVRMITDVAAGTFRMEGDSVFFSSTRGEEYHMVFQLAGSLHQELNGSLLVYRK